MIRCPSPVDLERSFVEPDREIDRHVADCERCGAARAEYESLRRLLDELPYEPMTGKTSETIRVGLVAAARVTRQRSRIRWTPWLTAAAAGIAFVVAVAVFERTAPPPTPPLADAPAIDMRPSAPPSWTRTIVHHDGTRLFEVPSLGFSSLLVKTTDADLWAERARFEILASAGRLERISVVGGIVELRREGGRPVVLGAGETWTAPREEPQPRPEPPPTVAKPRPAHEPEPVPEPAPEAEARAPFEGAEPEPGTGVDPFTQGWRSFRRGDYGDAVRFFDAAVGGPFDEDARYWRAVAELRRGNDERAAELLADFLARYPDSARAMEAIRLEASISRAQR